MPGYLYIVAIHRQAGRPVLSLYTMSVQKPALPRLSIDLDSPVPIARQIADDIRVALVRGLLKPGASLPPSRRLAADLAVHFNTVAQAYRELEQEGWLELRRKQGTVVRERPLPQPSRSQRETLQADLRQDLERLVSRYRSLGLAPGYVAGMLRETLTGIEGEK